jgi:ASC-1-like (ASCH) protein
MLEKPKRHTLRFNIEHRQSFDNVKNGSKRVETRAATIRYRHIKAGDHITFICGASKFSRTVRKAAFFRTISALFKKYSLHDVRPDVQTKKEMVDIWYSFPNYKEKIAKHGLMAFEFKDS